MNLILERFADTPFGVFGRMRLNRRVWYSVEKPWRNNQLKISCIPEGRYRAIRYMSPTPGRGEVWQLEDVPGRDNVQIHAGNTEMDVIGCIGLGTVLGSMDDRWAVLHSRIAMAEFMRETRNAEELLIYVVFDPKPHRIMPVLI